MKILQRSLGVFIALVLLYFLVKQYVDVQEQLSTVPVRFNLFWLIPSVFLLLFYWVGLIIPLGILLREFTQSSVSFRSVFLLFHLSNVTRYLPGRVWGVVRMLTLCDRFGISKTAVAGSLPLHVGFQTLSGGVVVIPLLFSSSLSQTGHRFISWAVDPHVLLFVVCVGFFVGSILFLTTRFSTPGTSIVRRVRQTVKRGSYVIRACWVKVLMCHFLLWLYEGVALFMFVNSLSSVHFSQLHLIFGCYVLAWLTGFLSILTPGGLGVREGILSLLLLQYIPSAQATLCALLCRVWMLSAEVVLAGVAFFLNRRTISAAARLPETLHHCAKNRQT